MNARRRALRRGLSVSLLLSVLAVLCILFFSARREIVHAWHRIPPIALAAAGGAIILVWLAKAGRMYVIARAMGAKINLWRFCQIYLTTCFVSHVTPFSAGGVPMQVFLAHREGMQVGEATALTVVDLGMNMVILAIVIPVVVALGNQGFAYRVPRWRGWLLGGLVAVIVGGLLWRRRGKRDPSTGIRSRFARWRQEYQLFRRSLAEVAKGGPWALLAAAGCTFCYWFFYLMLAPIILLGMGISFPWGYVLGAQLVFNFLQVLLPTPGGSGGSELLLLGIFAPLLKNGQAGVFVILWKFYTFYATLVLGGFFFWRLLSGDAEPETTGG